MGTIEAGLFDWMEIGVRKQKLRNGAGLIVKLIRDEEARHRLVTHEQAQTLKDGFRRREDAALRQHEETEERAQVFEYEQYQESEARRLFRELSEDRRTARVHQCMVALQQQDRVQRMTEAQHTAEAEAQVMGELSKERTPSFEKWRMRRMARQAALSLFEPNSTETEGSPELAVVAH